jgi:hypothetical protein
MVPSEIGLKRFVKRTPEEVASSNHPDELPQK